MRQRLGIATALIGDPAVLILDEPANGLDPAGIRWMRDLLRDYADRGGTVLLSSHLLREVEVIADDIVMIGNGRIVCAGHQGRAPQARRHRRTRADIAHPPAGPRTPPASTRPPSGDGALRTDADPTRVGRVALDAGVALTELRTADGGLEEMFLQLTADTQREGNSGMTAIATRTRPRRTRTDVARGARSSRVVSVELRKMFDTRSGFWLMASIVIAGLLATVATIAVRPGRRPHLLHVRQGHRVPDDGRPADHRDPGDHRRVEPAHRPDHVHAGPAPDAGSIAAKAISSVAVAVASMLFAFAIGAVGNLVGTRDRRHRAGLGRVVAEGVNIVLGNLLCLLTGTMLGMLIRNSAGALVVYFVYSLAAAHRVRVPGGQPGLVPGPAALGRPQLRPGRPVRGLPHR